MGAAGKSPQLPAAQRDSVSADLPRYSRAGKALKLRDEIAKYETGSALSRSSDMAAGPSPLLSGCSTASQ